MPIATKSNKIDITQESVTASLAKKFSKVFKNGDIVFLYGEIGVGKTTFVKYLICLLYTSPSPRDATLSRMPSSA